MQGFLAFRRYFDFSGRSGRAEFWQYILILVGLLLLSAVIGYDSVEPKLPMLTILVLLGTIVPSYAVTIRRLHDRGITGWAVGVIWILNGINYTLADMQASSGSALIATLAKVAAGGTAVYALLLCYPLIMPGNPEPNEYGPPYHPDGEHPGKPDSKVTVTASQAPMEDRLGQIERLAKLRHDGILTDAEFQQQKAALLK
ncbi:DUF805 domain-containing protein [Sphingobium sp. AN641]|uniref:DUF805 domain-containing protein n=1 Tax=Sphingobium sp. AN641 TaxID=3133443 RepID=UPI0030BA8105